MAIKHLKQTGEDNQGNFNVMDGLSFARALNNNADELGTTTKVDLAVHNTPEALRKAFREQSGKIGYHTPGGPDDLATAERTVSEQKGGLAQIYNESVNNSIDHIETYTLPDKLTYYEGEELDLTGMKVIAVEEDGDTFEVTDYTVDIAGRPLTTEDTRADVSYAGKHIYFTITVNAVSLVSIAITTAPTKTTYEVGETFNPAGMVLTGTFNNGNTEVLEPTGYTPDTTTPLTANDTEITVAYYELTATQAITVEDMIIVDNTSSLSFNAQDFAETALAALDAETLAREIWVDSIHPFQESQGPSSSNHSGLYLSAARAANKLSVQLITTDLTARTLAHIDWTIDESPTLEEALQAIYAAGNNVSLDCTQLDEGKEVRLPKSSITLVWKFKEGSNVDEVLTNVDTYLVDGSQL